MSTRLQVVVKPDELEDLKRAASAAGLPLGTYLRHAGLLRARKFNAISALPRNTETPHDVA